MKKLMLVCLILAALPVMTNAVMFQTQTFSFTETELNFSNTYTFDQFDSQNGVLTLQKVIIIANLEILDGYFFVTNTSQQTATYSIDYDILSAVTSGDVFISPAVDVSIGGNESQVLAPQESLNVFVAGMSATSEQEMTAFAATSYIGTGTFDFLFAANRTLNVGGAGGGEGGFSSMTGEGDITVIYEYVPEPATLALLGLGGLFIRRKKV